MSQLNKQVIFITGASSGMGKDAALQLIKEGHIVYGAARRVQQMEDLTKAGGHALPLDVTDENSVKKAVDTIIKNEGRIDVLVNNAGYAVYGAVEDTTLDDARRQYEVNIFGLAAVTKAVLPHMREQHSGKIINISSMGGKMYTPMGAWYHSTKHALEGWSDCLRLELKPFGIDVVIVEPGIIKTEFADVMHQPLLDRSGSGPYAKMANAVAGATEKSYAKGQSSSPEVITRLLSKIVRSRKPKTRYAAGKFAKPMMWIRKYLGDRIFDAVVMSQVK
ncbi:MAG TPA: short-chain dehydrogenase/reductase [Cytophagales bacterium]|jgi:short-subunit dehydrogenase|nr:short-chain dehydrogenase/reductase [Cytophagales bacterium]